MVRGTAAAAHAAKNAGGATARALGVSRYLPEWSEPGAFWASDYGIEIRSKRPVRIEKRHWRIRPAGGELERTRDGAGIGGQVRHVEAGRPLRYWSATLLPTGDGGYMEGEFSGRYLDNGDPAIIPVERFALAPAGPETVERQRWDGQEAMPALLAALGRYQKGCKAGAAVLDVLADLPAPAAWEFARECLGSGTFNSKKQGSLAVNDVLARQSGSIRFAGKYLEFTDISLYSENGFEDLRLKLSYWKSAQDWQIGENVDEAAKELLERIKDRPDLALACLKFLEKEVTRPEYAKLSKELTEARLDKERRLERERKARYRQRVREGATAAPR